MTQAIQSAEQKMKNSVQALKSELSKLRTGRANTALIDHIMVDYYGNQTPLNAVANIAVENARMLSVTPWEKEMVAPIEKAIIQANLGLNPSSAGTTIRVPIPAMTEERRKELAKMVRDEAERARVSIRNARRDANAVFKDLVKEKTMTEDDERRSQNDIQKLTDRYIADIDAVVLDKEKELMAV